MSENQPAPGRERLEGRVALVTGGAIRVGRAIAEALAARGCHVGITYRSSSGPAEELVAALRAQGVQAAAAPCDQRDPAQITAAVNALETELGPTDILVNNAAIFDRTPFEEATLEDWDVHLETNLRGPWLFCKAVGPAMKERGWGGILNMLDIAAERPYVEYLPYSASKAGLLAVTRGLVRVLAPAVRVNGIAPGTVLWPEDYPEELRQAVLRRTPLGRAGTPEDIAAAALYLLESPYLTGVVLPVDGGRSLV